MSFSKAKLIRFNDVVAPIPSPAKPKDLKKTCPHSPTTSENGSVKSVPASFKTPTLPKKIKTATPSTKIKPKDLFFNQDLEALREKSIECENKTKYIHELSRELDSLKESLDRCKREKELLLQDHQKELQNLEFEMLQALTELQKQQVEGEGKIKEVEQKQEVEMDKLRKAHEYKTGQLVLDYEIEIKELKEMSERELQDKLTEADDKWQDLIKEKEEEHTAILKECQEISEYNIIQCELEKKQIKADFDEAKLRLDELQDKLERTIKDKEAEIVKLQSDIKAYQVTISNSQTTIEVLKRRLIDSDRDVEQLKREVASNEEKLLGYENKFYLLEEQLQESKAHADDLEFQYESAVSLNKTSINSIKKELMNKVKFYEEQVKVYTCKMQQEQQIKDDIMRQLQENINIIHQINTEVEKTEEFYSLKIKDLEEALLASKLDKDKLQDLQDQNDVLQEKCTYYKLKSEEFEQEATENQNTRKKYIDISGKYDELSQDFEILNLENKERKNKIDKLEKELQRLQKIEDQLDKVNKDVQQLQEENLVLKNDQKLKKFKLASMDKENVGSPNRSIIESPNRGSPFRGSPFRERNN